MPSRWRRVCRSEPSPIRTKQQEPTGSPLMIATALRLASCPNAAPLTVGRVRFEDARKVTCWIGRLESGRFASFVKLSRDWNNGKSKKLSYFERTEHPQRSKLIVRRSNKNNFWYLQYSGNKTGTRNAKSYLLANQAEGRLKKTGIKKLIRTNHRLAFCIWTYACGMKCKDKGQSL